MSKIIFMDIDGTLLDHIRYHRVLDSTIEAIQKARANGHKIILCTGRSKSNVLEGMIPFESDGQIYGAGAMLETKNKLLYHICIPEDDLKLLIDDFTTYHFGFKLEGEEESFADPFVFKRRNMVKKITGVLSSEALFPMNEFHLEKAHISKATLYYQSKEDLKAFQEKWKSKYTCIEHGKKDYDTHFMCELLINHVNKTSGIKKMLEYFNMKQEDTIAFGDSMNDLDMLLFANIGICMENGADQLKKAADMICGPSYEDSIYDMFQQLKLI